MTITDNVQADKPVEPAAEKPFAREPLTRPRQPWNGRRIGKWAAGIGLVTCIASCIALAVLYPEKVGEARQSISAAFSSVTSGASSLTARCVGHLNLTNFSISDLIRKLPRPGSRFGPLLNHIQG